MMYFRNKLKKYSKILDIITGMVHYRIWTKIDRN